MTFNPSDNYLWYKLKCTGFHAYILNCKLVCDGSAVEYILQVALCMRIFELKSSLESLNNKYYI